MAPRFSRPPVLIRHPLAGFARVVQVQHRGNRVHPQPIDVDCSTQNTAFEIRKLRTSVRS